MNTKTPNQPTLEADGVPDAWCLHADEESGKPGKFATFLAHLPGMAYCCKNDADRTMLFVSEGCQSLTGYTPNELTGDGAIPYEQIIHPDCRAAVRRQVESAVQKGSRFEIEYRIITKDGAEKWVLERGATPLGGSQNNLIEGFIFDLTARKQSEMALRESEETLRATLHSIGDAVISTDTQGRIVSMNPVAEALTGWSEEDAMGQSLDGVLRIVNEQTRQPVECPVNRIMESRHIVGLAEDTLLIARDGREISIAESGAPIYNEFGDINGVVLVFRDQTEERAARQAREFSQQRIESMFRASPVGIGMVRSHVIVEANDRLCEITGYSCEEMVGNSTQMLYPTMAEFDRVGTEKCRQILQTGGGTIETVWKRKDGGLIDVWLSSSALDRTDLEKGVTFTALDVTQQKRIERRMVEQNELLAAIHCNAPLVMMVVNAERRIHQINGFTAQFAKQDEEKMLGVRFGKALRCIHALDNPQGCGFGDFCQSCTIRNTVLDTLETGNSHLQVEAPHFFKNEEGEAEEYQFLMSTTAIQIKGEPMVLVTWEDITDHKRAEAEKEMLQNQLNQAQRMESVGRLAGGVAHDFNNLLMGIMNYVDICCEEVGDDHPIREWLDEINRGAQCSADLTRQLLAFARKQTITPKVLDLNDTVATTLKMIRRLIGEDIQLRWQPGAALGAVKIDPGQLDQILANLCVNARDAVGGAGKVTIETRNVSIDGTNSHSPDEIQPGEYVMLKVSDNGCGMDPETLKNIFEPFYTTKGVGEGTGLGLATVYGILKQNEGFVDVSSELGEGTAFHIYLPRHKSKELEEKTPRESPKTNDVPPAGNATVLVVEDEEAIGKTIERYLKKFGYRVFLAESSEEALKIGVGCGDIIDVLISDVVMPTMNGRELVEKMVSANPTMKVIYISGYTADIIADRGILEEDVPFLSKPFTSEGLAAKLREVLDS